MNVQSTERIFDILEVLSNEKEGLRLPEIARRVDLHKSTVYRFLASMEERGNVEKVQEKGLYRLGLKLIEISGVYLNNLELKTEAQPYLQRLTSLSTQTVYLAIRDEGEIVYIEKVETFQSIYEILDYRQTSPFILHGPGEGIIDRVMQAPSGGAFQG